MDPATQKEFADFVRGRWVPLIRFAHSLTLDEGRAEDLVQESLVRLWKVWPRLRQEQPDAYARRILVNLAISSRRRRWWGEKATAYVPDLPENAVAGPGAAIGDRDLLRRALGRLPAKQRVIVVLRYVEDLPEREVAEILGCSTGTVKSQASRGLARLRELPLFNDSALPVPATSTLGATA
ncbi:SigE family RNA polymerase sigma factor [Streptomyces sp. H27-S2]|uniref:SigE family RNA polymerase sigma factor n=1 Tax=Streptomyces antarcticus TaxID=2996458 RepID=UPI00226FAAA9|nr:SigE family RNA polymerase sigma factor [Streptomyces sp. H27-S2]MCY0951375.1 SigE family RNA polymerase sigma factor [Streptomyces sp. H27-S2]